MNAKLLKSWKMDKGTLVSPRFKDKRAFDECKKFLIRAFLHADYDDRNFLIKIDVSAETGKGNLEKLKKMEILPS